MRRRASQANYNGPKVATSQACLRWWNQTRLRPDQGDITRHVSGITAQTTQRPSHALPLARWASPPTYHIVPLQRARQPQMKAAAPAFADTTAGHAVGGGEPSAPHAKPSTPAASKASPDSHRHTDTPAHPHLYPPCTIDSILYTYTLCILKQYTVYLHIYS